MGWTVHESAAEVATNRWYDPRYPHLTTKLNVRGRKGQPDQCYWLPLRPLLIEFKAGAGVEPRALQLFTHRRLASHGYEVQVHHSAEEAIQAIRDAIAKRELELEALWAAGLEP